MLLFTAAGLLFVMGCGEPKQPVQTEGQIAAGIAPDFTLRDLKDRPWTLGDRRGKPVLVIFTTTWCPSCRQEIPHYKAIYNRYHSKGLEVVNIDIQEPREKVSRFSAGHELPYPVILDETGEVAHAYGVVGVPFPGLIDKDGKVICMPCRSIDAELAALFP